MYLAYIELNSAKLIIFKFENLDGSRLAAALEAVKHRVLRGLHGRAQPLRVVLQGMIIAIIPTI